MSMAILNRVPMFSKEDYEDWKVRIQAHLQALDDDMWHVITNGPMKITKVIIEDGESRTVEKPRIEWTADDKRKSNLDNMARDILYKTLDKIMFRKIRQCKTAKEIWEKLTQLNEGSEQTKENKLLSANQQFENIKMLPGEKMAEFDERFTNLYMELTTLEKVFENREIAVKVMRALPREWDIKTMAMREAKNLNKLELHELFEDLKAYEFEMNTRNGEVAPYNPTHALVAAESTGPSTSNAKLADQLSNDIMALFIKKFDKFKKGNGPRGKTDAKCYNCDKPGHFASSCWQPKREQRKPAEPNNAKATKPKEQKALFAAEGRSSWAESDSEDEEETIKCFMANDVDEVFDFNSDQFSREELTEALNNMVIEYRSLSEKLLEVEAENLSLKLQAESPALESSALNVETNILREENSKLTDTIAEKDLLIQNLNAKVSAWTSSSTALKSMLSEQRPAKCKFGLGYSGAETTKIDGVTKVGKTIQFVKSTHVDTFNENKKLFSKTESTKIPSVEYKPNETSWLKPKVRVERYSKADKNKIVLKQKKTIKLEDNKTILFGKQVRIVKMWIPKGLTHRGPK